MAFNTSRSVCLAKIIAENTTKIEIYREEQGLPPLVWALMHRLIVEGCRRALIDATLELSDLAMGPVELRLLPGWAVLTMFGVTQFIFDFDIAQHVPLTGDVSYDDLSKTVNVGTSVLRQVLRAGMPYHMFYEPRPGHVAHTATTKVMARDPLIKDWSSLSTDIIFTAGTGLTEALRKEPAANDPAKTGFTFAKGASESSMYMYLEQHPELARKFTGVMRAFQKDEAYSPRHLINTWPKDLQTGKLVDIGGSTGAVAFALADEFPGLEIVVQDLPGALETAQVRESNNVSFMPHDFFNDQPVKDADAFLFRWVLHNWPDMHVQRILRALIPSLRPGTKIIIFDDIMPPADTMSLSVERYQRNVDFGMLTIFNAKIRDVEEWEQVISQSDQCFKVTDIRYPENSRLSLIEIVWQP
ncbi:S-adenosyl-L-methionine-dependent methyltransferase [Penicillium vulpinum]|uniref:S-adenosyl-L-methionine-dependent methyltransferase n=1 Tax=Penicillium vulpinum TaxID=29845 RepID=UPI002548DBC0|nr:S-adenosyl-L-methionine-dependent methyltransferase [Penicillium vulpinum]KAJ5958637.1 S-adenosyl-L-methionine-dependent methyltransferase [Penicillium vulpinum]